MARVPGPGSLLSSCVAGAGSGVPQSSVRWARRPGLGDRGGSQCRASTQVPTTRRASWSSGLAVASGHFPDWAGQPMALPGMPRGGKKQEPRPATPPPSGLSLEQASTRGPGPAPPDRGEATPPRKSPGTSDWHAKARSLPQSPSQGRAPPPGSRACLPSTLPSDGARRLRGFLLSSSGDRVSARHSPAPIRLMCKGTFQQFLEHLCAKSSGLLFTPSLLGSVLSVAILKVEWTKAGKGSFDFQADAVSTGPGRAPASREGAAGGPRGPIVSRASSCRPGTQRPPRSRAPPAHLPRLCSILEHSVDSPGWSVLVVEVLQAGSLSTAPESTCLKCTESSRASPPGTGRRGASVGTCLAGPPLSGARLIFPSCLLPSNNGALLFDYHLGTFAL